MGQSRGRAQMAPHNSATYRSCGGQTEGQLQIKRLETALSRYARPRGELRRKPGAGAATIANLTRAVEAKRRLALRARGRARTREQNPRCDRCISSLPKYLSQIPNDARRENSAGTCAIGQSSGRRRYCYIARFIGNSLTGSGKIGQCRTRKQR